MTPQDYVPDPLRDYVEKVAGERMVLRGRMNTDPARALLAVLDLCDERSTESVAPPARANTEEIWASELRAVIAEALGVADE